VKQAAAMTVNSRPANAIRLNIRGNVRERGAQQGEGQFRGGIGSSLK
jgi:hypothetical protein